MSNFINESLKKYTVKMDLDKSEKQMYLTMRISVFDAADSQVDFHKLAF